MLISWAASGVADNKRAATEAAPVMHRTRRPPLASIRSLVDGPANSPSPVRGYRKGRSCCPGSVLYRCARALARPGETRAAKAATWSAVGRPDTAARTAAPRAAVLEGDAVRGRRLACA